MVADNSLVVAGNSENRGDDSLGWTLESVVKKFGGDRRKAFYIKDLIQGVMRSAVNFVNVGC